MMMTMITKEAQRPERGGSSAARRSTKGKQQQHIASIVSGCCIFLLPLVAMLIVISGTDAADAAATTTAATAATTTTNDDPDPHRRNLLAEEEEGSASASSWLRHFPAAVTSLGLSGTTSSSGQKTPQTLFDTTAAAAEMGMTMNASRSDAVLAEAGRWFEHCRSKCDNVQLKLHFCMSACTGGSWDPATMGRCQAKCSFAQKQNALYGECWHRCHTKCRTKKCADLEKRHHSKHRECLAACDLCQSDANCTSQVCVHGECLVGLQPEGEACTDGPAHCAGAVCARGSSHKSSPTVCCRKGRAYDEADYDGETAGGARQLLPAAAEASSNDEEDDEASSSDEEEDSPSGVIIDVNPLTAVCGYQPVGAGCFVDDMCSSKMCDVTSQKCACARHKDCSRALPGMRCVHGRCQPDKQPAAAKK